MTPKPLTTHGAATSLGARLGPVADGIRQAIAVRLGLRPYRVFLVRSRWSGEERGEGKESLASSTELLPAPRVEAVTSLQNTPFAGGVLERGIVRVDRISTTYSQGDLDGGVVGESEQFWWEVVEDGRSGELEARRRFRFLVAQLEPDAAQWVAYLERMDEDRDRAGTLGSRVAAGSP